MSATTGLQRTAPKNRSLNASAEQTKTVRDNLPTAYEVEEKVRQLTLSGTFDDDLMFQLLSAYGKPQSTLGRLRSGTLNRSTNPESELVWKNQVYFRRIIGEDLHLAIDAMRVSELAKRQNVRFLVVTDLQQLLALDTKTGDTLDIPLQDLHKHFTFFLPWAGMEKSQHTTENLADIKAAERMAKVYDEIIRENSDNVGDGDTSDFNSSLNIFFSRLLFCFFAEDTGIFERSQFLGAIASHTQADGSDLNRYLDDVFAALNVENKAGYSSHLRYFPYVNGGLFRKRLKAPRFNERARRLILQCGELDWSQINPDIFGSMIQAVVHSGERAGLGIHYTSVENIMKVIFPLFVEPLREQFEKSKESPQKLATLRRRISGIKIFDPACGSGNFLVIAYKELRRLEHEIMVRSRDLGDEGILDVLPYERSMISLENFYGIEIDDFAHEIAILSLHLARHQMNVEFEKQFGTEIPLIPLTESANVVLGNAARISWDEVCPNDGKAEIYVVGNPPYLGSSMQKPEQKADFVRYFASIKYPRNLDYISLWFFYGSRYIADSNASLAFVSTNSVCQGDHVGLMWPTILRTGALIVFAHQSFPWSNSARGKAGVTCIVVGLSARPQRRFLYSGATRRQVSHISPYLLPVGGDTIVRSIRKGDPQLPPMVFGSKPTDGGNLILTPAERNALLESSPDAAPFLLRYCGADEFLSGSDRYCIWVPDAEAERAAAISELNDRFLKVAKMRARGSTAAQSMVDKPYRFLQRSYKKTESIMVPRYSSGHRDYIPIGYLGEGTVISDAANAIYDARPFVFGVITSRMHMVWVRAVSGRLKGDYRYSNTLVYNTFPLPALTEGQKQAIEGNVFEVFDAREQYSERTLSELYDSKKMPSGLRRAHGDLDEVVDHCYRTRPFLNDEERLAHLFSLYEQLERVKANA